MNVIFINIEGIDGTGKSTVSNALIERLKKEKDNGPITFGIKNIIKTDFPAYASPTGKLVKEMLKGNIIGNPKETDPIKTSLFYTLDRMAYFINHRDDFKEDCIVISDRSYISNFIYQASKYVKGEMILPNILKVEDKLCEFMDLMWTFENPFKLLECGNDTHNIYIRNFYLYHPDINTNFMLMEKRGREKDLYEEYEFLNRVNQFALRIYSWIDAFKYPDYNLIPIQCSDKYGVFSVDKIIDSIYDKLDFVE